MSQCQLPYYKMIIKNYKKMCKSNGKTDIKTLA
jgi:hypothetical protein